MFAKLAALGMLAVLIAVPAVQAAPVTECLTGYHTAPYTGPVDAALTVADRALACGAQPAAEPLPEGSTSVCASLLAVPSTGPSIQPVERRCVETGPEPQAGADVPHVELVQVQLVPFLGSPGPQPLPGKVKQGGCTSIECRDIMVAF